MPDPINVAIYVIGASGRTGTAICRALLERGNHVCPVVRDPARWQATGLPGVPMIADLMDAPSLRQALAPAQIIVSAAHARHTKSILAAAGRAEKLVLLGSTRKFTRWPDAHGNGVLAGEAAFLASGRNGVMLHPTMIFGAHGENNVQRLAALLRRLPLAPLPGGGRSLVQPIHQDDVVRCVLAALAKDWRGPSALVIAGPEPMTYETFVRAVAAAAGLPRPRLLSVPAAPLRAAAALSALIPGVPTIKSPEIRRLLEDKAFDIAPMVSTLGVTPIPLAAGLARTFAPQAG